jgi:hypothetical protein
MVTTNSPYTRTIWVENYAWNEIIQEVNNLATNPDEGCDPVGTLEEVEENHIWNKVDVKKVQDKLKEICPDNEFTELLDNQPWTSTIIDEIIVALEVGWCECRELDEYVLGQWVVKKMYGALESPFGSEYNKCGGRVETGPWWYFTGQIECRYPSPCYNINIDNTALWQTIQDSFTEATENGVLWAYNRREELMQQRFVEQYATQLKSKREQLENLQNQLAACQSSGEDCSSIETQISEIEADITELEGKIQEAKNKRDDYKSKAENYLITTDAAATANWNALAALQDWEPEAIQVVKDHIGEISSEWGLGNYPYNYRWSTWGVGKTWWYAVNPTIPIIGNMIAGKFTPSGIPFSKGSPLIFGSEWWYQKQCREKCGWWAASIGDCVFEEWSDWGDLVEYRSDLPTRHLEGDKLELKFSKTDGTKKAESYNPNPDQ